MHSNTSFTAKDLDLEMDSDNLLDSQEPSHPESAVEQVTSDFKQDGSIEKMPHLSLEETEESDTRKNLIKHRQIILTCLKPSQLFSLIHEFKLEEIYTNPRLGQCQQAELLYEEIVKRSAYSTFLNALKLETEHLGHRYIASLLTNQEFVSEEITKESQRLSNMIASQRLVEFVKLVSIPALTPLLFQNRLLTSDELEKLSKSHDIARKNRMVSNTAQSKGPYSTLHICS